MTHADETVNASEDGRQWAASAADMVEYRLANCLWMYVAPALVVVGVVGNALSLVVLLGRAFRKSSLRYGFSFQTTSSRSESRLWY